MKQIFEHGFFHADPHPGNLFVNPNGNENSNWQLTFVDFGMVGHIPPNAMAGLREFAIGLGTKDSKRMIKSYQMLGMLLPGADLDLIQKADSMVFDRFWGKNMDELKEISFQEVHEFTLEFRELVYDMPFQAPQDIIFLIRTISILAGICIGLYPEFNFWEVLAPYTKKLISEEVGGNWQGWLSEAGTILQSVIALPRKAENLLTKLERGEISIRTPMIEWQLRGVNRGIKRVGTSIFFLAFLTNGIILYINQYFTFAWILFGGATLSLISGLFSRRSRRSR
ncbi:MAG: AarF/ABC1/UbiB kinase family protein [Chloroflexi bacterium]|nr:AarF/ABC1/UbiB kinase family protein [Chloroflexota bacterium]